MIDGAMSSYDEIRRTTNLLGCSGEAFASRFTAEQLILLYRAYMRSDWDVPPHLWTEEEIADALKGRGKGARSER